MSNEVIISIQNSYSFSRSSSICLVTFMKVIKKEHDEEKHESTYLESQVVG